MKHLLKDAPTLETTIQAILFRVYTERKSVEEIVRSLDDETWVTISESLGTVSDQQLVEYIANKESDETIALDLQLEATTAKKGQDLKVWVTKTVVGTLATVFLLLSAALAYSTPEHIVEIMHNILSLIGGDKPE